MQRQDIGPSLFDIKSKGIPIFSNIITASCMQILRERERERERMMMMMMLKGCGMSPDPLRGLTRDSLSESSRADMLRVWWRSSALLQREGTAPEAFFLSARASFLN